MGFTDKAVNAEMMRRHNCHFDKVLENLIANIGRPSSSACTPGDDSRPTLVSRLLPLRKSDKPPAPSCIEEAVMHLAHAAIFDAGCVVYGGFLRDWVVRGETAGDVDVETSDYDATGQAMSKALQEFSISISDSQQWGQNKNYRRLRYTWQGNAIYVDLVNPVLVPFTPPGVDCDVGNLQIDKDNGLHLKVSLSKLVSLAKSIKHRMSKKFVLFYDLSVEDLLRMHDRPYFKTSMCNFGLLSCKNGKRCTFAHGPEELRKFEPAGLRLEKYIKRGWICKSHVPRDVASKLGLPTKQLQPKKKYCKAYWHPEGDTNLSNLSDPDVPDKKEPEHWDSTALNTAYYKILTRAGGNGASKSDGGMGVERVMLEGGEVERLETPVPRTGSGGGRNMSPGEMGECGAATMPHRVCAKCSAEFASPASFLGQNPKCSGCRAQTGAKFLCLKGHR
jgi:hypothetical protein